MQLRGRYLRDKDNRFGILLVVHNSVRARGWKKGSVYLTFAEVMTHLKTIAGEMASADALAPQMTTVGIDLSSFTQRSRAARSKMAATLTKAAPASSTEK